MKINLLKYGIVCGALLGSMQCAVLAQTSDLPKETPEAFLGRYYTTLHSAKSMKELFPWFTPGPEDPTTDEILKNPEFDQMVLSFVKAEPKGVKIVSKNMTDGKMVLEVKPSEIPAEYAAQAKSPNFSMTGTVILVPTKGEWKVHKDFWTVKVNDASGSSKTTFGRNPDKKKSDDKSGTEATQP